MLGRLAFLFRRGISERASRRRRAARLFETPGLVQKRLREHVFARSRLVALRPSATPRRRRKMSILCGNLAFHLAGSRGSHLLTSQMFCVRREATRAHIKSVYQCVLYPLIALFIGLHIAEPREGA